MQQYFAISVFVTESEALLMLKWNKEKEQFVTE